MKTAKLRLMNPKPTLLLSPRMQALRHSGTHTQSPEGGQERGMVRRLLPVRMFNKQERSGSFYPTEENTTALIAVPPSHTDLSSMRHVPPAFQTFLHHFLSHRRSKPTHSRSTGMCPPSCHLPRPGGTAGCGEPRQTSHGLHRATLPGLPGTQGSQPAPAPSPSLSLSPPWGTRCDTPRSSRHAGHQELKLGREANGRVMVTQEPRKALLASCRIVLF